MVEPRIVYPKVASSNLVIPAISFMKKFVLLLIIVSCSIQPDYEPFHMEMLSRLYTISNELELNCVTQPKDKISKLVYSLNYNSLYLENHMKGLEIKGKDNYSINISKPISRLVKYYNRNKFLSSFFCREQTSVLKKIIEKSMQIEKLRK